MLPNWASKSYACSVSGSGTAALGVIRLLQAADSDPRPEAQAQHDIQADVLASRRFV